MAALRSDPSQVRAGAPPAPMPVRIPEKRRSAGGFLFLLLPLLCCGGPLIVAAVAAASAATLGVVGVAIAGVLALVAVGLWVRRRRAAAACCAPGTGTWGR